MTRRTHILFNYWSLVFLRFTISRGEFSGHFYHSVQLSPVAMPTETKDADKKPLKKTEIIALSRKSRALSMIPTIPGMRQGTAQWKALMKRFHETHKETCKATPKDIPMVSRSLKQFPTGSSYEGTWNLFGMSGRGTYVFPHKGESGGEGVKYVGDFHDGQFHGEGELQYDCGATIKGKWNKGVIGDKTLVFADGLEYSEQNWKYCRYPDRRYTVEYDKGLEPAGRSYMTAEQPAPDIPPGLFDCGDGFFDPNTKTVYKYNDPTAIVRSPGDREQKWIVDNCRYNPDYSLGPCGFLFETWMEPSTAAEEPPPPAARTKTYEEELQQLEREIYYSTGKRRQSRRSVSRFRGQSLYPQFDSRRGTEADEFFYKPSYMGHPNESRAVSGISLDPKMSIRSNMYYDASKACSKVSTTFGSDAIYYKGESSTMLDSSFGLLEKPKSIVNW